MPGEAALRGLMVSTHASVRRRHGPWVYQLFAAEFQLTPP